MRARRALLGAVALAASGAIGFIALAWWPAIDAVEPPARSSFDPTLLSKGTALATIGNCNICHTKAGGPAFAGGQPLRTPFGTIYSTNITPDPETGLGRWSLPAFVRAMREGIDRKGRHLYPAFPYHHFAKLTDDDIAALYAFVMTREPVRDVTPPNKLPFPFNIRALIAGWNLLFLERGVFRADAGKSEEWNRGAYLVEGLGHCGGCHTPFNLFGAEKKSEKLAGGQSEGWDAPALNAQSPAPAPWTRDRLFAYLRHGWDDLHGMAVGPMEPITRNLARAPERDVRAIAAYIDSLAAQSTEVRRDTSEIGSVGSADQAAEGTTSGSLLRGTGHALFAGICAECHVGEARLRSGAVELSLSGPVNFPEPRNLVQIILRGVNSNEHQPPRKMPAFADIFDERQIAAVATYVRDRFGSRPTRRDLENDVRSIKKEGNPSTPSPTDGDARLAPALVARYGCAGCHKIPGVQGPAGLVGPPLGSIRDQVYLAGALTNTQANLVRWITDPQSIKPNTAMPNTGITEQEARHIATFLYGR